MMGGAILLLMVMAGAILMLLGVMILTTMMDLVALMMTIEDTREREISEINKRENQEGT